MRAHARVGNSVWCHVTPVGAPCSLSSHHENRRHVSAVSSGSLFKDWSQRAANLGSRFRNIHRLNLIIWSYYYYSSSTDIFRIHRAFPPSLLFTRLVIVHLPLPSLPSASGASVSWRLFLINATLQWTRKLLDVTEEILLKRKQTNIQSSQKASLWWPVVSDNTR